MTVGAAFILAVGAMPLLAWSQSHGGDRGVALPDYDLSWYTVDGGGEMFSTGGDYELSGTIGQPDASEVMIGDEFELTGGFWFRIPPGDWEDDGDVDLNDFEAFEYCLTGPDGPVVGDECRCFDVDRNNAVDLSDLATIQTMFTSQ
jgi:hypothetical protein